MSPSPRERYVPIRKTDVDIGMPLPCDVYDDHKNLLLKGGFRVETQNQLGTLIERGLYRERVPAKPHCHTETREATTSKHRVVPLEDTHLAIGDVIQLQEQAEHESARYGVKLIGYLRGQSLVVTVPEIDHKLCYLRDGQPFVARYFVGRNAYACTTDVIRTSSVPFPHIYLSYPSQVRELAIRAGERVPAKIICSITLLDDSLACVTAAGVMTNLSIGGALLAAKAPLGKKGCLLTVKFRLNIGDIEVLASVEATICSVTQAADEFLHGLQFAGLPNELVIALRAFVYQRLIEKPH